MKKSIFILLSSLSVLFAREISVNLGNCEDVKAGVKIYIDNKNIGKVISIDESCNAGLDIKNGYDNVTSSTIFKVDKNFGAVFLIADMEETKKKKIKNKNLVDKNNIDTLTEVVTEGANGNSIVHYYDSNDLIRKVEYNQNGQIEVEEIYKNGIKDEWTINSYHSNGNLNLVLYQKYGDLYGKTAMYYENGQLSLEGQINAYGAKVGTWTFYKENGDIMGMQQY